MFAQVVVILPLPPLSYRIPPGLTLAPGDPVKVRVRNKIHDGIVVEIDPVPLGAASASAAKMPTTPRAMRMRASFFTGFLLWRLVDQPQTEFFLA